MYIYGELPACGESICLHEWYKIHPGACTAYAKDLFLIKVSCMTIYYVYAYIPQDKNRQRPKSLVAR